MSVSEAQSDVTQRTDWKIEDDLRLPRVLLLGDSISIWYTHAVREALEGRANVHRALESPTAFANCRTTTNTLAHLDKWLGDKPWDVIHCNWGLHDLACVSREGSVPGLQVPIAEYEKNLEELVGRLKRTGATLIYATTTPVPDGVTNRSNADVLRYNEAARKVMRRQGVAVNDLYAFALPRLSEIQRPVNVHFHAQGSQVLGQEVARVILEALNDRQAARIKVRASTTMQSLPANPALFLDDQHIAAASGVRRIMNRPTKHPQNPVMVRDQPWEARVIELYGTVLYDDDRKIFRCWYLANEQSKKNAVVDTPEGNALAKYYQCYAESDDGVVWRKPPVGRGKLGPYDRHNMVIPEAHGFCVIHTPDDPDPNRRYKGAGGAVRGISPNGIDWTLSEWRSAVGKNDTGTSVVRWNGQYLAYVRYQISDPAWPGVMRGVGLCVSDDFEHWSTKELILRTDERDGYPWVQPYGLSVTPYGDQLIGLLWMLRLDHVENNNRLGDMDVQLVVSRDGRRWARVADQQVFLASTPESWDRGRIIPSTTLLVKDDEVYIYYTGTDTRHGEAWGNPAIGLARLPKDRFVAVRANRNDVPGIVQTTPLLTAADSTLVVNAAVSSPEDLKIELMDERCQKAIDNFDCSKSHLRAKGPNRYTVVWVDQERNVRSISDRPTRAAVSIRFILRGDASLYSFEVQSS